MKLIFKLFEVLSNKYLLLNRTTIILFIFIFSLMNTNQIRGCALSTFPAPIYSCSTPFSLNSYGNSPSGGSFSGMGVTNPSPGNYVFNPALVTPNTSIIITYITSTPACTTTSTIIVIDANVSITPTTSKYTYTPSTATLNVINSSSFSNFTWYKNGFVIPGFQNCNSCSTLVLQDMGTYTVRADGPCGGTSQDEIELACDCDFGFRGTNRYIDGSSTPYVFSSSTLTGAGGTLTPNTIDYVFDGTIIIPAGVTVSVNGSNIKMMPCTRIIIESGSTGNTGGKLSVNKSTFSGCDKWDGIVVEGNIHYDNTHSEHGFFEVIDSFEISDAYKAIYAYNGGLLNIHDIIFENNEDDITVRDDIYPNEPIISNSQFKGKWIHNDIATICGSTPSGYVSPGGSGDKKMIYLENVNAFNIEN